MRILPLIVFSLLTVGLVIVLNTRLLIPAPLGELLSPQHGVWQNAEDVNTDFSADLKFPQLKGKVTVYFDERLVPHVFAEDGNDVYFVQGFLHAKFRLWQMELQTLAAAGRASEIAGKVAFAHDREFRRLGMGYAAEASLKEMESDPQTKLSCDNYTAGVNAYIATLKESSLPLEYKLIGYKPEQWSNLKTALFLKNMSENLAAAEDDFEMTNAKSFFSPDDFAKLYPFQQDSLDPIIPKGTVYEKPKLLVKAPANADSLYFKNKDSLNTREEKPDKGNGSNNWAVAGSKTVSGAPILCNDPHLNLNLPSIWFEMQLSTPEYNCYGSTFPGAPGIIIGYNDSCAWGVTNGGRDVRDYYEIKFKDDTRKEYWFDSTWQETTFKYDTIKVRDSFTFIDTIAYTVFGPVMYDKSFSGQRSQSDKYFAVRWKAHDPSNELKTFLLLNSAKNYNDYLAAVSHFKTPGQNFAFASKSGDIAMRTQGEWPAKWKGQGDFVMPGTDSSYVWQGMIPQDETPAQYNPERGFVSSANQSPADSTYPYYLGRFSHLYRGIIINRKLSDSTKFTPETMMKMQTNNYNQFAEMAVPVFIKNIREADLNGDELTFLNELRSWDYNSDVGSKGATIFALLWFNFRSLVYDDEFANAPKVIIRPDESSLLEGILRDSAYKFLDNTQTVKIETLADDVTTVFKNSIKEFRKGDQTGKLEWGKFKATTISHLLKLPAFSRRGLPVGGGENCINATKQTHGPSWRMVVSLTPETEAYGVYPGGQSGNPGSIYYDNFIDKWAAGEYYNLWMMKKDDENNKQVKWKMSFNKS